MQIFPFLTASPQRFSLDSTLQLAQTSLSTHLSISQAISLIAEQGLCTARTAPEVSMVQVPRRAMAAVALLLESGRNGLLLPLLSEEMGGASCVQQLVHLADRASQPSGASLPPALSGTHRPIVITWHRVPRETANLFLLPCGARRQMPFRLIAHGGLWLGK